MSEMPHWREMDWMGSVVVRSSFWAWAIRRLLTNSVRVVPVSLRNRAES